MKNRTCVRISVAEFKCRSGEPIQWTISVCFGILDSVLEFMQQRQKIDQPDSIAAPI